MNLKQNDLEFLDNQVELGIITADEANVRKVEMQRVLLIIGKLPIIVRRALNQAVKEGRLAHKKKDEYKPEVYFKPDFEYLANEERNRYADNVKQTIRRVYN